MPPALSLVPPWRMGPLRPCETPGPTLSGTELSRTDDAGGRTRGPRSAGHVLESEFASQIFSLSDGSLLPLPAAPRVAPATHVLLSFGECTARRPREGD